MIESIKNLLWGMLKEKKVSLVLIYDEKGRILWHRGRQIKGKSIHDGEGFSKTFTGKTIRRDNVLTEEDVLINLSAGDLTQSAEALHVKSLLIFPINSHFFLYIDSGTKSSFTETDYEVFKMMGRLLGESIREIRENESNTRGITGTGEAISKIRERVLKFSLEEDPVLLLGETGVGKTHIAGLIHRYSGRRGKFVVTNTATINENLFESEVFGHKRGAFTGAAADRRGLVDEAKGGTLFFDEIAEVPFSFQAKLLRFIEKKKYRVLGETAERDADVRVVAATNKDLRGAIEEKEFREDLFFRLNVLGITIPPLRMRKEDIKDALEEKRHLLKGKETGNGFLDVLTGYHWPGNFREFFTVLKRAGILCDSPITGKKIRGIIDGAVTENASPAARNNIDRVRAELSTGKSFWRVVKEPYLNRDLNRFEAKCVISKVLLESGGRYVDALPYFNIDNSEYRRFMKFIHKNRLQ